MELCWNCRSDKEPVHSVVTDTCYCVSCGAVLARRKAGVALPGPDEGEDGGAGAGGHDADECG